VRVASRTFQLEKWYLDVVAEDGRALVAYWLELRWRSLRVRAASTLVAGATGATRERTTLVAGLPPRLEDGAVRFACGRLDVAGRWSPLVAAAGATLLDGPQGHVTWECVAPTARVSATVGGETFEGLGYAERLTMTVPPWRLPIRELRWGRFAADEGGLVWIEWRGDVPRALAFRDGRPVPLAEVRQDGVSAGGVELTLTDAVPLRSGALGRGPLRRLAGALPAAFLRVDERKWRARGSAGGASGWVIHEVVRWS
jgi:hypothetical protein